MVFSVEIGCLALQLLLFAFSYGSMSQQIKQLKEAVEEFKVMLKEQNDGHYSKPDGERLENAYKDLFNRFLNLPCKECVNHK